MTTRIYFHGLPGCDAELHFLQDHGIKAPLVLHPAQWRHASLHQSSDELTLIGFSIGTFGAIRAAAASTQVISSLQLISPAASLELGDFLPDMAGGPIFKATLMHQHFLTLLSYGQAAIARVAPERLMDRLFAKSHTSERTLLNRCEFRKACQAGIQAALIDDRQRYISTINEYVRPWAQLLDKLECPVHIYQGCEDTWTPPAMATALSQRLGDNCSIEMLEGLGHYSTLHHSLPRILRDQAHPPY